jgi:hypothetical protein
MCSRARTRPQPWRIETTIPSQHHADRSIASTTVSCRIASGRVPPAEASAHSQTIAAGRRCRSAGHAAPAPTAAPSSMTTAASTSKETTKCAGRDLDLLCSAGNKEDPRSFGNGALRRHGRSWRQSGGAGRGLAALGFCPPPVSPQGGDAVEGCFWPGI